MKIAYQHQWKDKDYTPHCAWGEDTFVQWGSRGVVLGKNPYSTAFFEAFPKDKTTGGFIRGEGETIEAAEDAAFAQFQKETSCSHLWGREHYRNSGQLCRHCRAFRCGYVREVVELGHMRKPLKRWESAFIEDHSDTDNKKYLRQLQVRKKLFGAEEGRGSPFEGLFQ